MVCGLALELVSVTTRRSLSLSLRNHYSWWYLRLLVSQGKGASLGKKTAGIGKGEEKSWVPKFSAPSPLVRQAEERNLSLPEREKSSINFGKMGSRPTHPKLLDWLYTPLVVFPWEFVLELKSRFSLDPKSLLLPRVELFLPPSLSLWEKLWQIASKNAFLDDVHNTRSFSYTYFLQCDTSSSWTL